MTSRLSRINLKQLPLYERQILHAIAFFQGRPVTTQAYNALTFYLRQSEPRVASQVGFYARRLNMSVDQLYELIYTDPEQAKQLIQSVTQERIIEREEPDVLDDPG